MKKILAIAMAAVMVLSLAACGGGAAVSEEQKEAVKEAVVEKVEEKIENVAQEKVEMVEALHNRKTPHLR